MSKKSKKIASGRIKRQDEFEIDDKVLRKLQYCIHFSGIVPMKNLADNFVVRFINISRKKEGMFANFKVKGIKGGTSVTASIAVDIMEAEVDPTDPLEKIIEECARIAVKELKKSEFQFEGMALV